MSWDLAGVNWLGVAIAATVGLVIGFVWYAPPILGRRWEKAAGSSLPHIGRDLAPATLLLSLATVFITAYALALLANAVGVQSAIDGAALGLVTWLGFYATALTNGVIFERRSSAYWSLSAGLGLLTLVSMGAVTGCFA